MDAAVPDDVDETDQTVIFPGADPAEAVTSKPCTCSRTRRLVRPNIRTG
jgi:hypothetical protein